MKSKASVINHCGRETEYAVFDCVRRRADAFVLSRTCHVGATSGIVSDFLNRRLRRIYQAGDAP